MDYSNEGVLYFNDTGDGLLISLQLKSGLVDSEIRISYPSTDGFDKLDKSNLYNEEVHFQISSRSNGAIIPLSASSLNPNYIMRRKLIKLRAPLMEFLVNATRYQARTCSNNLWEGFENNMQYILSQSDPDQDIWHNSILEYSHVNEIEPKYAYREIKLQVDNILSYKMRIYSFFKKFVFDINNVVDEHQANTVRKRISDKFYKDTWV